MHEEFEDTKRVIRIRKSKKDRQHNNQKKKDKQRSTKPVASHWQTLVVIGNDCTGSCKSNYHTIKIAMAPCQKIGINMQCLDKRQELK